MKKKKKFIYMAVGAVGLAAVLILCFLFRIKTSEHPELAADTDVIFTVDEYPVSRKEFSLFIRDQRADTAQYFFTTYGAEMKAGFWTTEFDGQTPSDYCKEKAVEELVRYKTERILAYERGLVESVDYSDLMKDMESLNDKNAKSKESGEVMYGLTVFEPWQYLLYTRSDCSSRLLKDEVDRSSGSIPEETLRARYEEEKESYHKGYEVTYERLETESTASEGDLETALGQIAERALEQKESLKEAAAALDVLDHYTVKEEVSSEITVGKDDVWEQFVQEEVRKLEPGIISTPLLLSGSDGCLLRGIERTDQGYESFEDVKSSIILDYAGETLKTTLEQRVKDASVVLENDKYEQIIVE